MLKTRQKIALASWASSAVCAARRTVGLGRTATISRKGVRWRLDLSEGVDFSIFLLGAFEPGMVAAHRRIVSPGQTVIDVGANIGAHTLHFARFVGPRGRVVAVEPTGWAYGKLIENISLNPEISSIVHSHQVQLTAVSGEPVSGELYSSWPLFQGKDALHEQHGGRLMSLGQARALTLDELVAEENLKEVHLIKIDVDGHEWAVLQGARNTLSKHRPKLVVEFAPYLFPAANGKDDFAAMIEFLLGLGYGFSEAESGKSIPADPKKLREWIPSGASVNALATARA